MSRVPAKSGPRPAPTRDRPRRNKPLTPRRSNPTLNTPITHAELWLKKSLERPPARCRPSPRKPPKCNPRRKRCGSTSHPNPPLHPILRFRRPPRHRDQSPPHRQRAAAAPAAAATATSAPPRPTAAPGAGTRPTPMPRQPSAPAVSGLDTGLAIAAAVASLAALVVMFII